MTKLLARWRVALGFVLAAVVLWEARPTAKSLMVGASIALLGELLRTWAAGHLEKSKEVTSSGPYRYMRHPLYLGSSLIGIGLALAANNLGVFVLVILYLAATLTAAMRSEEAHLREKFGGAYDAYAERRSEPMVRRFSWSRALGNREHHTMLGLLAGFALLTLKLLA
jgi:protein-S-isoprenylcysteine O-methyltransferase Ste14